MIPVVHIEAARLLNMGTGDALMGIVSPATPPSICGGYCSGVNEIG